MLLDVVIEKRFYQCAEGKIWTDNAFPYAFWLRYLAVFESVNIVARVHQVDNHQDCWQEVTGESVSITVLPGYIGAVGLIRALPAAWRILSSRRGKAGRALYRVPGILAWLYNWAAGPGKGRFGIEVVGDPADTFASGASSSAFGQLYRALFQWMLRRQCQSAGSVAYVTQSALQQRYPPAANAFHTHYSSILLQDEDYAQASAYMQGNPVRLICIGNLSQPYKGCDLMLYTLKTLNQQNAKQFQLTWVGGGALLNDMEALCEQLGLTDKCQFVGNVASRESIRNLLDAADIFVLPSRQEGLPRVLIEAMARSKLCVATRVGGVPELLSDAFIVPKDDSQALAKSICDAADLSEEQRLIEAKRNFDKARDYHDQVLEQRRLAMYRHLRGAA